MSEIHGHETPHHRLSTSIVDIEEEDKGTTNPLVE